MEGVPERERERRKRVNIDLSEPLESLPCHRQEEM